jgi:hypothetical protein
VAGKIRQIIDKIIEERAKGSEIIRNSTRTKLILKGFNPDKFNGTTEDKPEMIARLQKIAVEMGVKI